jgi:hypothetical protein
MAPAYSTIVCQYFTWSQQLMYQVHFSSKLDI